MRTLGFTAGGDIIRCFSEPNDLTRLKNHLVELDHLVLLTGNVLADLLESEEFGTRKHGSVSTEPRF